MAERGARTPSGRWNRLKPVNLDPLESVGLPSKGDNSLLDFATQERYYRSIVERYMSFCSDAGQSDELLRRFGSLAISNNGTSTVIVDSQASSPVKGLQASNYAHKLSDTQVEKTLSTMIMAMRKLREGLVASKRIDAFSVQCYIFCIRSTILLSHMESYHPALLHLLMRMQPNHPLSKSELQEFVGYLVLDLACRQGRMTDAYSIKKRYSLMDGKILDVLKALVHDDYELFWRVQRSVDGYKLKLMQFSEPTMRLHALKCLGRAYLNVDLGFVEHVCNKPWRKLVAEDHIGWELHGDNVIIRKPKVR